VTDVPEPQAYPAFRHQLEAMLARIARADREAIGSMLRSLRIKPIEPDKEKTPRGAIFRWTDSKGRRGKKVERLVDFRLASPISNTPRQGGDIRFPHFAITRVNKVVVPKSRDGRTHHRYPERSGIGVGHHEYVTKGGVVRERDHLDYLKRAGALDSRAVDDVLPALDLLDGKEDWRLQNSLAIYSNIPGGAERERSLFEAAERRASAAKTGTLSVSSEYAGEWMQASMRPGAPSWVRAAAVKLATKNRRVEKAGRQSSPKFREVEISTGDLDEIFVRLSWCDGSGLPKAALPNFKPGRCGRIQTRFVGELPRGLGPRDRHEIFTRFCDHLSSQGWMIVGAIHRPDPHNDPRNYHFHIDGYDRPAKWLDEHACWDFDFEVKHRNGKPSFPYRQNKIADVSQTTQKGIHYTKQAANWMASQRQTYVDIVNDVVAGRPGIPRYVAGTYQLEGIERTPLGHLGNKIIAAEKEGLASDRGSENARTIFADELRAVVRAMEAELKKLDDEAKERVKRAKSAAQRYALGAWRQIKDRAIVRSAQNSALPVIERMASSRAVTILEHRDTATPPQLIQHARAWLRDIETVSQLEKRVRIEGQVLARLERSAAAELRAADELRAGRLPDFSYVARSNVALKPVVPKYRNQLRLRLSAWLDQHLTDPARVEFAGATFKLGYAVRQPAIDRLLRLFGHEAEFQIRLAGERSRRAEEVKAMRAVAPSGGKLIETADRLAGTSRPATGGKPASMAKGPTPPAQAPDHPGKRSGRER